MTSTDTASSPVQIKKSERTRKKIADAYIALMQSKTYDRITVREIIDRAEITRSTFYAYFDDIYSLLEHIESSFLSGISFDYSQTGHAKSDGENYPTAMVNNLSGLFNYCKLHRDTVLALTGEHGDPLFGPRIQSVLEQYFDRSMTVDCVPDDNFRPYYIRFLSAANLGTLLLWLKENTCSSEALAWISEVIRFASVEHILAPNSNAGFPPMPPLK